MTRSTDRTLDVVDDVRQVIVTTLGIEPRADELAHPSSRLFGSVPEFDSFAVVELIVALEERFGITVDADDVTVEVFATLGSLSEFVDGRIRAE